ncbi:uncharacterized protein LOC132169290 [Corylus avellana]|uniref:uncharacterized protein LOC132169290 n=1 Tax=Corylus avellana TaxID=13451 RepID=UPI00286BA95F|nr:uncharacterized protein LOC132169290 [Corylus avellana]
MRAISWNCRRLGNPETVRDLCHMVKEKKPLLVFLMETKMNAKKMEFVRIKLKFDNMFAVDSVGRSGGLALLWMDKLQLSIQNFSRRHINGIIRRRTDNGEWKLTGFYGHPDPSKRRESWGLLRHLATLSPKPWMCMCDFNEIVGQGEKWGGVNKSSKLMADFREALEACNLSDLGALGPKFSWHNGRQGNEFTKERLDRAVVNLQWCDWFPSAEVAVLASRASDHNPLLINLQARERGSNLNRHQFRYEARWSKMAGMKEIIKKAWRVKQLGKDPGISMGENMKRCRGVIRRWVQKQNHDTEDLNILLEQEDLKWGQKPKVDWLRNGDRNTKYFHACASQRKRRNQIEQIHDSNGRLCTQAMEIEGAFVNYFQTILTSSNPTGIEECTAGMGSKVTREMNSQLLAPFMNMEVKMALDQMDPMKAPGPDGFTAKFYQQNWETVKEESAFIPGRLISDNILVAYETLHTMHSRMWSKVGYMEIKLDMSKAYDRVEWRFLETVMGKLGFDKKWISLIMECVSTVSYAVVVNGNPVGHIIPSRGIRQGDPLSPYLFLLCAEALSSMLNKPESKGVITGVPTSKNGPRINHLFFADDSLLFCKANLVEWRRLT